ncbi:hypothetical protein OCF99_003580, partial [Acinetobacter baumannii]
KIDSGYYLEFKKYPKGLKRDEYFDTVLINHSEKEIIKKMSFFEIYEALLHKPISKGLFHNIIFK